MDLLHQAPAIHQLDLCRQMFFLIEPAGHTASVFSEKMLHTSSASETGHSRTSARWIARPTQQCITDTIKSDPQRRTSSLPGQVRRCMWKISEVAQSETRTRGSTKRESSQSIQEGLETAFLEMSVSVKTMELISRCIRAKNYVEVPGALPGRMPSAESLRQCSWVAAGGRQSVRTLRPQIHINRAVDV